MTTTQPDTVSLATSLTEAPRGDRSASRTPRVLRRLGADTRYALTGLPVAVLSFVVLVVASSLSLGLLVVVAGLITLAVTLHAARGLAGIERLRLAHRSGRPAPAPAYPTPDPARGGFRRFLTPLRGPQYWRDLAHGVLALPVAIVGFAVTVTWWAAAAGGLTYAIWSRYLPAGGNDAVTRAVLGGYTRAGDIGLHTGLGLVALLTLPFVVRAVTAVQAGLARTLLVDLGAPAAR